MINLPTYVLNESKGTHQLPTMKLQNKDCVCVKTDKGNKVLILDKRDYFDRVKHLLNGGSYTILSKNPSPQMVIPKVFKKYNNSITPNIRRKQILYY